MQADVAAIDIVLLFRSNQPILCYSLVPSQRLISYQLSSSHRSNKHPSLIIKHLLDHLIFKIALIAMSSLIQPLYEKTNSRGFSHVVCMEGDPFKFHSLPSFVSLETLTINLCKDIGFSN